MAAKRKKSVSSARAPRRSCICTNMSDLLGGVGTIGVLGAPKRRRSTARSGCKIIRTRKGGVRKGCYNSQGQFRFVKN